MGVAWRKPLVGDVREQRYLAGPLDLLSDLALVKPTGSCFTGLADTDVVVEEPFEKRHVLIVNHVLSGVRTKPATLPASSWAIMVAHYQISPYR